MRHYYSGREEGTAVNAAGLGGGRRTPFRSMELRTVRTNLTRRNGLAHRPQCRLSAGCTYHRCAPRDRRRIGRDKGQWLEPALFVRGRFGSCSLTDPSLEFRLGDLGGGPVLRVRQISQASKVRSGYRRDKCCSRRMPPAANSSDCP